MQFRWENVDARDSRAAWCIDTETLRICGQVWGHNVDATEWIAKVEQPNGALEGMGRYLTMAAAQRAVEAYWRPRDAGASRHPIDERKFAAFIRHYGVKFKEGDEDAYALEIPLAEWANVPEGTRVIPADNLGSKSKVGPTVAYITFVEPATNTKPIEAPEIL